MKAAIVVLSDPKSGSEESLGRLFNAFAAAYDFKNNGDEVTILFQGAGSRWIGVVKEKEHPAHELFKLVKDKIVGVAAGCALVFGATEAVTESGFALIQENAVPGTGGLPSLRNLVQQGYSILTF
jgi:hypothetical protein